MTAAQDAVVAAARTRIGDPYAWGATGPNSFDCSGLCQWAYTQIGVAIPRTSQQQAQAGQPVSRDQLQPGDLIIYYPDASHVALYSGNGNVISASTYGVPVAETPIDAAGPYNTARRYLEETTMTDTLFADVSEFQAPVDDSYPYQVISIRSNDGTYEDHNFAANLAWCKAAADAGRLTCFLVYFVWRPNWQQSVDTLKAMIGQPHPKMAVEIDIESWEGQITGDQSDGLNGARQQITDWLGDPRRSRAYGNTYDLQSLWPNRPTDLSIRIAGYGSNPSFPGKDSHQYTNGTGFGAAAGLPDGAPPFGNCDMNSADGLDPVAFAAACGITTTPTTGGPLMALTDDEQQELLDNTRWIKEQLGPNIWGPDSSLGTNDAGEELTARDGLAAFKREVEAYIERTQS